MYLCEHFAKTGHKVTLIEKEQSFMSRASFNNQARVHSGYHYPRSVLTALRSRISFPRFLEEFRECIDAEFAKYYLIGRPLGKVSARQFHKFCERIGASCEQAPNKIQKLVNPKFIEACFQVEECAFNADKLRSVMVARLLHASIDSRMGVLAESVRQHKTGLVVTLRDLRTQSKDEIYADHVFNCAYSNINYALANSGLELIPLKHEMTEMCLVQVPEELQEAGITVMCGPFFSVMPFPPAGLHSFSHVRYTPHNEWCDEPGDAYSSAYDKFNTERNTAWLYMQRDAMRYMPILSECRYHRSLWEVKTILPRSDHDDSRPILFRADCGLKGLHCVMGGKIDNVYDAVEAIGNRCLLR